MILNRSQKGFFSQYSLQAFKEHVQGMRREPEICCITSKGKSKNSYEWIGKWSSFMYSELYVQWTLGQFFSIYTYSLTGLGKDISVLLKVINIWTSS